MGIISYKCESCGAMLELREDMESGFCTYCGTSYSIEREHAGSGDVSVLVKAGDTFIKIGDYRSARQKFEEVTRNYPYDYRGWWGLIKVITKNLTDTDISKAQLIETKDLFRNVCATAGSADKEKICQQYEAYDACVRKRLEALGKNARNSLEELNKNSEKRRAEIDREIKALQEKYKSLSDPGPVVLIAEVIAAFIAVGVSWFSEDSDAFPATVVVSAIIGGIAYKPLCKLLGFLRRGKIGETRRRISVLQGQLQEMNAELNRKTKELNEQIRKSDSIF